MYRQNVKNNHIEILRHVGTYADRAVYFKEIIPKPRNEISRSLKQFASMNASKQEPASNDEIDQIMQEFACNGHSSDDLIMYPNERLVGFWRTLPLSQMAAEQKKQQWRKYYNNIKKQYSFVKHCVFCENNKEPDAVVRSHAVRDAMGRVLCPKLRVYICPICKASGDLAHTVKYCPQKPIVTMEDAFRWQALRSARNNASRQHMKV